jgi:hypothetical protein
MGRATMTPRAASAIAGISVNRLRLPTVFSPISSAKRLFVHYILARRCLVLSSDYERMFATIYHL